MNRASVARPDCDSTRFFEVLDEHGVPPKAFSPTRDLTERKSSTRAVTTRRNHRVMSHRRSQPIDGRAVAQLRRVVRSPTDRVKLIIDGARMSISRQHRDDVEELEHERAVSSREPRSVSELSMFIRSPTDDSPIAANRASVRAAHIDINRILDTHHDPSLERPTDRACSPADHVTVGFTRTAAPPADRHLDRPLGEQHPRWGAAIMGGAVAELPDIVGSPAEHFAFARERTRVFVARIHSKRAIERHHRCALMIASVRRSDLPAIIGAPTLHSTTLTQRAGMRSPDGHLQRRVARITHRTIIGEGPRNSCAPGEHDKSGAERPHEPAEVAPALWMAVTRLHLRVENATKLPIMNTGVPAMDTETVWRACGPSARARQAAS